MAPELLAPLLAVVLVFSGMFRWDSPPTQASNKPAVLAAADGCPWNCGSAPVDRGRELARRTCGANQGQFLISSTVLFNRSPSVAAVSCLAATRAFSHLLTLHHLQVKLQV